MMALDRSPWLVSAQEPIPVIPTVHYNMGGIPTNYRGQVPPAVLQMFSPLQNLAHRFWRRTRARQLPLWCFCHREPPRH